jgi:hypothetical protein
MRRRQSWTLALIAACAMLASAGSLQAVSAAAMPASGSNLAERATAAYGAALPRVPIVAQGVSSANRAHLVRNRAWDFAQMRHVFNTVSLLPGDPSAVRQARLAGLAVVLEFDYKSDFFAGSDISAKVNAVVQQIQAAPGTIAAIDVADRINEKYSPQEGLRYLAATAGVLHRAVPGIPVLVNVSDWELTCGRPNQSSCKSHGARFQYETNAVVDQLYRSGYVDGFTVANNLKNNDVDAQREAWTIARARWPAPFILWSTCSQLSFPDASYPGTSETASGSVTAYMTSPLDGGADGLALWAWHQLYQGGYYSFLNKNGSGNALWTTMATAAADVSLAPSTSSSPTAAAPTSPSARERVGAKPQGSSFKIGFWPVVAFGIIVLVLGVGLRARVRTRRAAAHVDEPEGDRSSGARRGASLRG